ncbi:OmpA family protein [Pendulispora albinea]|uniref:Uncharacterized protein n=1 Tax=Pendulispora albinea TaxID=2741071 RepID=A0ABZ2LQI8_9BACT
MSAYSPPPRHGSGDPRHGNPRAMHAVDPPPPEGGGRPAFLPAAVGAAAGVVVLLATTLTVRATVSNASDRLKHPQAAAAVESKVAVADQSEEKYCTPNFKTVLQRVLNACGLVGGEARRGCQPADVKTFASIDDDDFNALFTPLKDRGAVIMFDDASETLDAGAKKLLEERWLDRKGARYFFIVARASRTGSAEYNRTLSHKRANSVHFFLQEQFKDPDLEKQVGMLWLGNEFAQLTKDYCDWPASRGATTTSRGGKGGGKNECNPDAINRSAFVSWVDCRL